MAVGGAEEEAYSFVVKMYLASRSYPANWGGIPLADCRSVLLKGRRVCTESAQPVEPVLLFVSACYNGPAAVLFRLLRSLITKRWHLTLR